MLLFQQQERLFLQERKIDGGNLFTEETEILNLGAGEAVSGQALLHQNGKARPGGYIPVRGEWDSNTWLSHGLHIHNQIKLPRL